MPIILPPVTPISRNTIADGDALNGSVINDLCERDLALAQILYDLSGNAYLHDKSTNSIYHFKDNDPTKEKVYAFSAESISANKIYSISITATDITATNVSAQLLKSNNVSATNSLINHLAAVDTSATNITTQSLTAQNISATNTYDAGSLSAMQSVTVLSAENTQPTTLYKIVEELLRRNTATNNYISSKENDWSSISAISAQGMSSPFTGNTFKLSAGDNIGMTVNAAQDTVTIAADTSNNIYAVSSLKYTVDSDTYVFYTLVFK